jgi:hypothetical protein
MKEIFYFLQWQWRRFETWQKMFVLAMFLIGCAITAPEFMRHYFYFSGMAIIGGYMLKWILWDGIKSAWQRYQEEKQKVINILSND